MAAAASGHLAGQVAAVSQLLPVRAQRPSARQSPARRPAGGDCRMTRFTPPKPDKSHPWDAFADDQLGLMDHLGIREFFFMGYCIGGCFAGKLLQRAPDRGVAAVFHQTVGDRPEDPGIMYRHSTDNWLPDFKKRRPEVSQDTIDKYFHSLWRAQPDFLYSVPRDFIKNCRTPILVLPDDTPSHPLQTSIDVASLAPNSDITVFPWREPEELRQRMIAKVRAFLKSHIPMRAAARERGSPRGRGAGQNGPRSAPPLCRADESANAGVI